MIKALLAAVMIVAHEPGYYTSLSRHLQRWLASTGVAAEVIAPADMGKKLPQSPVAFLVGFHEPGDQELKELAGYLGKGGKLVVFHSASAKLGALMGVKPTGYRTANYPGRWSRMDFAAAPKGFPAQILQTSTVMQSAEPLAGKSRVLATWSDRAGKPTGDAAWLVSAQGYWMTHVLLPDGDEELKAQLAAAICGSLDPRLWDAEKFLKSRALRDAQIRAFAKKQVPRKGEIHAVWDHTGCGLYPGNWAKTIKVLEEARVTDLFVNVAGAGFAHYDSRVLPKSQTFRNDGDQLAACLKAAKGHGIRVHAWVLCFNATRGSSATIQTLQQKGWALKTREGQATEYLNPAHPDVQQYLLAAIREIGERYPVDGIHLDFVRWYENVLAAETTPGALTRYRRTTTKPSKRSFWAWRAREVQAFVAGARARVKAARPGAWLTAAVLGKYPSCVDSVGQDWMGWIDAGLIDYAVPMNYTEDGARYASYVAQQGRSAARARKIISGIGVTANESRLGPLQVMNQVNMARQANLAGVALFDLDYSLVTKILPYLCMGMF